MDIRDCAVECVSEEEFMAVKDYLSKINEPIDDCLFDCDTEDPYVRFTMNNVWYNCNYPSKKEVITFQQFKEMFIKEKWEPTHVLQDDVDRRFRELVILLEGEDDQICVEYKNGYMEVLLKENVKPINQKSFGDYNFFEHVERVRKPKSIRIINQIDPKRFLGGPIEGDVNYLV